MSGLLAAVFGALWLWLLLAFVGVVLTRYLRALDPRVPSTSEGEGA